MRAYLLAMSVVVGQQPAESRAPLSLAVFDEAMQQHRTLSFAAFDSVVASGRLNLACLDPDTKPLKPAAQQRPSVTIYSPTDFICQPCQRMEALCGAGDSELVVHTEKRPLAQMPARVQRQGQQSGYPVLELPDGTLVSGARPLVEVKRLARTHAGTSRPSTGSFP